MTPTPEERKAREWYDAHGLRWFLSRAMQTTEETERDYINDLALLLKRTAIEAELIGRISALRSVPPQRKAIEKHLQNYRAQLTALTAHDTEGKEDVTGN